MKPFSTAYTANTGTPYAALLPAAPALPAIPTAPVNTDIAFTDDQRRIALLCKSWLEQFCKNGPEKLILKQAYGIDWDSDFATDKWKENFLKLVRHLSLYGQLPATGHPLYSWAWKQRKRYIHYGKAKRLLLDAIKVDQSCFRPRWTERFNDLASFMQIHRRTPSMKDNVVLYKWLKNQKNLHRQRKLDISKFISLVQLGIVFGPSIGHKDQWEHQYEALKRFIADTGRWPGSISRGEEKKLYNWYRNQKQAIAGTLSNRKPLPPEKLEKLALIGIIAGGRKA